MEIGGVSRYIWGMGKRTRKKKAERPFNELVINEKYVRQEDRDHILEILNGSPDKNAPMVGVSISQFLKGGKP